MFNNFIRQNAVSIAIAATTLISTYAVYGYRLSAVEARQDRQSSAITALQSDDTDFKVAVAEINTNLEYIKAQLATLVSNQNK